MAVDTMNPSLEELANRIRDGRSTLEDRQTLFHAFYCMAMEAGDIDFEAMGSDEEEVKGWQQRYADDDQAARDRCEAEYVPRPTY